MGNFQKDWLHLGTRECKSRQKISSLECRKLVKGVGVYDDRLLFRIISYIWLAGNLSHKRRKINCYSLNGVKIKKKTRHIRWLQLNIITPTLYIENLKVKENGLAWPGRKRFCKKNIKAFPTREISWLYSKEILKTWDCSCNAGCTKCCLAIWNNITSRLSMPHSRLFQSLCSPIRQLS